MENKTILNHQNPNIFSLITHPESRDSFDKIKRHKKIIRRNSSFTNKNFCVKTPNLYKSFLNSSSPYNYVQIPQDKNTFLICYNGGPKVYAYVEKDKLSKELDKKDILYREPKQCGCFKKIYIPKLTRNLSNLEKNRINNKENYGFKKLFSGYNQNFLSNKLNFKKENRYLTPNKMIYNNNNNKISKPKKFNNKNNNDYDNYLPKQKISFENCNNKLILKRNKYDSLLYKINRNIDKKFHRTQIFDHCKPFLMEGL